MAVKFTKALTRPTQLPTTRRSSITKLKATLIELSSECAKYEVCAEEAFECVKVFLQQFKVVKAASKKSSVKEASE